MADVAKFKVIIANKNNKDAAPTPKPQYIAAEFTPKKKKKTGEQKSEKKLTEWGKGETMLEKLAREDKERKEQSRENNFMWCRDQRREIKVRELHNQKVDIQCTYSNSALFLCLLS